ncbi:MAG: FAD binding domain-containing protein [bacterium]
MRLPNFDVYKPSNLLEALQWLNNNKGRNIQIIAGGTDLLVNLREPVIPQGHRPPLDKNPEGVWKAKKLETSPVEILLALWNLRELQGIGWEEERLRVGAMCRIKELAQSPLVDTYLTALADGAKVLGTTLVRNRGTFGGNICNARPAADTAIPTLALEGKLHLVSYSEEREVPFEEFVISPGKTVRREDEILKEIYFPSFWSPPSGVSSFIRLSTRLSLDIAIVSVAVALKFSNGGRIEKVRIALGAVGPTPLLAYRAMEHLEGRYLDDEQISIASRLAIKDAKPINDFRGSREYREWMVEVLVRRALIKALRRNSLIPYD